MTDLDRKRARDRQRQARLTAEGLRPTRATMTAEQLTKAKERDRRSCAWRQVGREFDRVLRLPDSARLEVKRALDDCYDDVRTR